MARVAHGIKKPSPHTDGHSTRCERPILEHTTNRSPGRSSAGRPVTFTKALTGDATEAVRPWWRGQLLTDHSLWVCILPTSSERPKRLKFACVYLSIFDRHRQHNQIFCILGATYIRFSVFLYCLGHHDLSLYFRDRITSFPRSS